MHPLEAIKEGADTSKTRRARRVAMVGAGEAGKPGTFGMSAKLPVLEGHLECSLDSC